MGRNNRDKGDVAGGLPCTGRQLLKQSTAFLFTLGLLSHLPVNTVATYVRMGLHRHDVRFSSLRVTGSAAEKWGENDIAFIDPIRVVSIAFSEQFVTSFVTRYKDRCCHSRYLYGMLSGQKIFNGLEGPEHHVGCTASLRGQPRFVHQAERRILQPSEDDSRGY